MITPDTVSKADKPLKPVCGLKYCLTDVPPAYLEKNGIYNVFCKTVCWHIHKIVCIIYMCMTFDGAFYNTRSEY